MTRVILWDFFMSLSNGTTVNLLGEISLFEPSVPVMEGNMF